LIGVACNVFNQIFCGRGIESSGLIKGGQFLGQLVDCQILKTDAISMELVETKGNEDGRMSVMSSSILKDSDD
jgi:hypothetical protein